MSYLMYNFHYIIHPIVLIKAGHFYRYYFNDLTHGDFKKYEQLYQLLKINHTENNCFRRNILEFLISKKKLLLEKTIKCSASLN